MKLFLTAVILFGFFPTIAGAWELGDHVMIDWTQDDYWYPATIVKIEQGEFFIVYDDYDREWVDKSRIAEIDLQVGDWVESNWEEKGYYYTAEIIEKHGNMVLLEYEDGFIEATTIAYVRVLLDY